MSRANRRAAMERAKRHARKLLKCCFGIPNPNAVLVGRYTHTPKPCSCWGCGNQRRADGPTRQERKQPQQEVSE